MILIVYKNVRANSRGLLYNHTLDYIQKLRWACYVHQKGFWRNDDGSVGHLEIQIGNSIVMLFDSKQGWPETPSFMRLYVEDGENVINLAKEAGANVVTKLTYLFFGESGANPRSMGQHLVDSATSERGWFVRTRKANA